MRNFERSLPMSLLIAREAVMAKFTPVLREHGLSSQQWRVLRALIEYGELDATELSNRCCLMMPSLSRILKNMLERGLIARRTDSKDQRRSLISLTSAGEKLFDTLAPWNEARYDHIENILGKEKLEQLYALLDETIDKLNHLNDQDKGASAP